MRLRIICIIILAILHVLMDFIKIILKISAKYAIVIVLYVMALLIPNALHVVKLFSYKIPLYANLSVWIVINFQMLLQKNVKIVLKNALHVMEPLIINAQSVIIPIF